MAKAAVSASLTSIKQRLREGKITKADLKKISSLITQSEKAAKALRAAVIE
jgi:hypothetical protein